ncbi:MAG: DinB family protein [Nitrolancea sp.]
MNDPIRDLFRYHTWATLTLLDFCAGLPDSELDKTTPGTMGTIRETFTHMIASDSGYQARMRADPSVRIANPESRSLAELREVFIERSKGWEAILDDLESYDPAIEAHDDFPRIAHARNLLLTQALHHGNDHRTHICGVLGANGHEIPWMDAWAFWAEEQG